MSLSRDLDVLRERLDEACAIASEYVLFGSTVLLLHGLREQIGDVDVFVTRPLFRRLRRTGWTVQRPDPHDPSFLAVDVGDLAAHAFYRWTPREAFIDAEECMREAEIVEGWPCAPLRVIAAHKRGCVMRLAEQGIAVEGSRWEKHLRDLRVLDSAQMIVQSP